MTANTEVRTDNQIRRDREAESYWRSRISAEVHATADEIEQVRVGAIQVGGATAQIIRSIGNLVGRMPVVLNDDPGPTVTEVLDFDGDRWNRSGSVWECKSSEDVEPLGWAALKRLYGPIRTVS